MSKYETEAHQREWEESTMHRLGKPPLIGVFAYPPEMVYTVSGG